ncbi:hypothetical protein MKY96_32830 [Paenibacillus sp. FSL R7-0302]|uniref:hypothetical protein n=1 Tax=Paenibacillus sp. FSL R7-0302 TaxID=2921681 RepID=UPI0030FC10D9
MNIILLVWGILMLFGNVKGYIRLFQSEKEINVELYENIKKGEESYKEGFKTVMKITYFILIMFNIAFWIVVANIVGNVIITLIIALFIVMYLQSTGKIGEILERRYMKVGRSRYIVHPTMTIIIVIFIGTLLGII